jgi:predicted nucleic acid-binding protein
MRIILDSNVFDDLVNGKLDSKIVESKDVYITHIQVDELNECTDKEKRARLFNSLTEIQPHKVPTESFVIGTSRIGSAKIGDGNLIEELRMGNHKKTNDALIGETALKNNLTLITNDKKFKNKVIELGGNSLTVDELISE